MAARAHPLSGAIDRSREHKRLLLERAGPVLSAREAAELLGTDGAGLETLRMTHRLLAIPLGEDCVYPASQFRDGAALAGLGRLLEAHSGKDPWVILDLLLAPEPALSGRTLLQALRDGDEAALRRHISQAGGDGFA